MSETAGSRAMTIGRIIMLLSVSAAMRLGAGATGLLLCCFGGILVGASLVVAGVCMADGGPAPIMQVAIGGARALAVLVRLNAAAVGLVMASCAFTVVSGEEDPVLCFGMFALLLLGLTLVSIGARCG